ncbi:MAG: hypothetical protein GY859_33265 [Desulfobacterales bacterium]|nr:hypothetical protein [Desulfobacterales bacterium]
MFSRKWVINLILLGVAVFLGMKAYDEWRRTEEAPPEAPVAARPGVAPREEPLKLKRNSRGHYDIVAEKNLFSSKREEPPPEEAPPPKKRTDVKKKKAKLKSKRVVLHSVISLHGERRALVKDPSRRSRDQKDPWVREGDTVAGMTVVRIESGKILLNDGGEDYEIFLYDKEKPKRRTAVRRSTGPTIIATGSGRVGKTAPGVRRPKKPLPKKVIKKPKQKPKKKPKQKPPRVKPKKKATATQRKDQTTSSGRSAGGGANPFENLLRRD